MIFQKKPLTSRMYRYLNMVWLDYLRGGNYEATSFFPNCNSGRRFGFTPAFRLLVSRRIHKRYFPMSEQNQAEPALGENENHTNSPVASIQRGARPKRCAQCGKPFGLIRRRSAGLQFCSAPCMDGHAEGVRKAVEAKARWYSFLHQRR